MNYQEIESSTVQPVPNINKEVNIETLEKTLLSTISKKDYNLLEIYNNYSVKSNSNLIKDIVNNVENLIKNKNINTDNMLFVTNIFNIIRTSIQTLEISVINKPDYNEIFITIFASIFTHYKKIFLDSSSEV